MEEDQPHPGQGEGGANAPLRGHRRSGERVERIDREAMRKDLVGINKEKKEGKSERQGGREREMENLLVIQV